MLEPMALPMESRPPAFRLSCSPTTISGADVPTATNVRPMTILETPRFLAAAAEAWTNRSALQIRALKPMISATNG